MSASKGADCSARWVHLVSLTIFLCSSPSQLVRELIVPVDFVSNFRKPSPEDILAFVSSILL